MYNSFRYTLVMGTLVPILAVLPWVQGQDRPVAAVKYNPTPADGPAKTRDLSRMTVRQRHFYLSAQRGTDWLQRANKPDGRFVHGFLPALRVPMEGDQFLRQVGAAWALGRGAAFLGDERAAAVARQALLTLLLETGLETPSPQPSPARGEGANEVSPSPQPSPARGEGENAVRFTSAPSSLINRQASAGLLMLAIHDLPAPEKDLLDQADQLGNFLKGKRRPDGSLAMIDVAEVDKASEQEAIEHFSGLALHGIIRSQTSRPAAWKIDCLRQAQAYYHAWWVRNKSMPMVPGHTAAYAEAYALTREKAFADTVFAMNDWLCTLQHLNLDPRRGQWSGGFMPWVEGKAVLLAPDIRSAAAAESLADACRTAQLAGDVGRHKRYREALENCLQFLTTLQYTEANTQHFAEWYRRLLVGGFHASPQDGNLRLDYTQHALCALVQYLRHVAELP